MPEQQQTPSGRDLARQALAAAPSTPTPSEEGQMTDTDPFVPKGQPRPFGGQTCGYKPRTASTYCGKPGTWHVMWDSVHDNSVTCDEHMQLIQQRWVYDDRHPIAADCTMPGALWSYRDKRCAVSDSGTFLASFAALEAQR